MGLISASHQPLIIGDQGFVDGPECPFNPERPGPFRDERRRLPAAVRLFSGTGMTPAMDEAACFAAIRFLIQPTQRRAIHKTRPTRKHSANQRKILMWLFIHDDATAWWKSWWGWRSPREFSGWRQTELDVRAPHIEPHELARLRLPEDVVMDLDVVVLQAWCQGVTARWADKLVELPIHDEPFLDVLKRGLTKLHRSPWTQFLLASHHLQPVGITFPGRGFSASTLRMDAILRDPYSATDGELEVVLETYTFKLAYAKAAAARQYGGMRSPDGPWYACGSDRCLGPHFHEGGVHKARDQEAPLGEEEAL